MPEQMRAYNELDQWNFEGVAENVQQFGYKMQQLLELQIDVEAR